jgi:cobalt-zinc-cadmium efflux system outer membrane protein
LGVSVTLPIFNHNEGPVAEAETARAAAAAHFLTVQSAAVTEIDSALAGYSAALKESATAKSLLENLSKQLDSARAQANVGEMDALTLADAESAYCAGAQDQLNAVVKAQQALGTLEDAVESPLTLSPQTLDAAQKKLSKAEQ